MSKVFGKNLRYYRTLAGYTQDDLAKLAGITRNAVANYEVGRSEPNFSILCTFANHLGVDIDTLLQDSQPEFENARKVLLSENESILIDAFRTADPVYQTVALDILKDHRKEER